MFDVSFWELALIGVIALLVVGPERLPGLARSAGLWIGRARRFVNHVRADIERELRTEELRKTLQKPEEFEQLGQVLEDTRNTLSEGARKFEQTARGSAGDPKQGTSGGTKEGSASSRDPGADASGRALAEGGHAGTKEARSGGESVEPAALPGGDGAAPSSTSAQPPAPAPASERDDERSAGRG
jgi:sec-independent protein translocase protein TatB